MILAPPHRSLPPVSAESVIRNLASERADDQYCSFSSLGLIQRNPLLDQLPAMISGQPPLGPNLVEDNVLADFFNMDWVSTAVLAAMSPTPGLQVSSLPVITEYSSPSSEDGELVSPPVNTTLPLPIDSIVASETRVGRSTETGLPDSGELLAEFMTAKDGPPTVPLPQPQAAPGALPDSALFLSDNGFLTPTERSAARERTISGLIRRYSLLEVQLTHELDVAHPPSYQPATEVGRHARELDLRRRHFDNAPPFLPHFSFPERRDAPRSPTPGTASLDNALELTINGRAPSRPNISTIQLPTDAELRTMFDMDSQSTIASPVAGTSYDTATSAHEDEVMPTQGDSDANIASLDHTEINRTFLAESQASARTRDTVMRQSDSACEAVHTTDYSPSEAYHLGQEPETPPRWIMRQEVIDSERRSHARSTPRSCTEPALRHSSVRTQQSIRSVHREDSPAAQDLTVGTEAINYLAHTELHPHFTMLYRITEMLGAGGYGFVCIAKTTGYGGFQPDIEVAVKFLFKSRPGAERTAPIPMMADVPLEAFLLRNMDHGGIIDCIDLFEDPVMYYMVSLLLASVL